MNTLQHDGFLAEIFIDEQQDMLRGIVVNAQEPFKFEGRTVAELKTAFIKEAFNFKNRAVKSGETGLPVRRIEQEQHLKMVKSSSLIGRGRPSGAIDYWTLQEAYHELLLGLYLAWGKFTKDPDSGRAGAKSACDAVINFISCRWENPELASPFVGIREALIDVKNGRKPAMFSQKQGLMIRPQERQFEHLARFVAALHEVDINLGTPAKESALRIARSANSWPQFKNRKIDHSTVKNWRDRERANAAEERRLFEAIVAGFTGEADKKKLLSKFLNEGPPGISQPPKKS